MICWLAFGISISTHLTLEVGFLAEYIVFVRLPNLNYSPFTGQLSLHEFVSLGGSDVRLVPNDMSLRIATTEQK